MTKKMTSPIALLIISIFLLALGVVLFILPKETLTVLAIILVALSWVNVIATLIRLIIAKKGKRRKVVPALVIGVIAAALITLFTWFVSVGIAYIIAVVIFATALTNIIYGVQLILAKEKGFIFSFIKAVLEIAIAVIIVISPFYEVFESVLAIIVGVYCILEGVLMFIDAFREFLGTDLKGKAGKKHVRLKPSILFSTFLPMVLLRYLDDHDEEAETKTWTREMSAVEHDAPNLEIFLHLGKNAAFGLGHCDIALKDKVYSYGTYDPDSNKLGGLFSDGVMLICDKATYIPFSVKHEKKRLIGYKVVLTDEQVASLEKEIANFLTGCVEHHPTKEGEMMDMVKQCNAKYYKITKGPFRYYNAFRTNCVAVANILCGSSGVDLMNPQGIITPGTYADFLERQLARPKSIVVGRTLYK